MTILGNCETLFLLPFVVQYRQINAGTLALLVARNGTKLEKTSLSTDGSKAPAYDIVYIAQLSYRNGEFRNHLNNMLNILEERKDDYTKDESICTDY